MLRQVAVAAVAAIVASACGGPAESVTPRPEPPLASRPSATASPPAVPADSTVYYSAAATLTAKDRGSLSIRVKREVRPDGKSVTTVTYERSKPCHEEGGSDGNSFVSCPVAWRKIQRLTREEQFTLDAALASAELTDTLDGKRVSVRWTASGALRAEANENGNLLFEARDAVASSAWGTWTYSDAPDGPPSLLARRIPAPAD